MNAASTAVLPGMVSCAAVCNATVHLCLMLLRRCAYLCVVSAVPSGRHDKFAGAMEANGCLGLGTSVGTVMCVPHLLCARHLLADWESLVLMAWSTPAHTAQQGTWGGGVGGVVAHYACIHTYCIWGGVVHQCHRPHAFCSRRCTTYLHIQVCRSADQLCMYSIKLHVHAYMLPITPCIKASGP